MKSATNSTHTETFESSYISIHAPTRGATKSMGVRAESLDGISIHAHIRGATYKLAKGLIEAYIEFQSARP